MAILMWMGLAIVGMFALILIFSVGASRNRSKYQGNTFSREEIIAKINSDYLEGDRPFVIEQLERLGPLGATDVWVGQAQFSALVLAESNAAALPKHIEVGLLDTRDLIVKAGMG